ncbi:NAD(P)-dependent oxidoreductase [Dongia soli]|uniref:NAD(P)-dependent oxidoreductase n=1 Tax=Dongia soli TaxID=600628 RepID=A0ABU5EBZ6_9PROT|nr:NAD(P)-dependent oxidoreductase [Dongia soli]MDY0883876.1 NAD(P)-dependent oxidoreductase [Dongia soli]
MPAKPKIAFLGIGLMGLPMAENLLRAGFPLIAWNRTAAKLAPLEALGGEAASSPADAATNADIIITMLLNGDVVEQILAEIEPQLRPGQLLIDMSSIAPRMARGHAHRLAQRHIDYLDAPVSGGTVGAVEAKLAVMAGGDETIFQRAQPVFAALGKSTLVGPHGAGQLAKLANQAIVGITIGAVAEALLLAKQGGADPAAVRHAITGGFADSRILAVHGERMITGNFKPGGTVATQIKDLRNILDEAAALNLDLPFIRLAYELFQRAAERGDGELDHSALYRQLAAMNKL